jgi:hypothetical protein
MTSLKAALKRLEGRGLITKSDLTLGFGKQQGIKYSVSSPDRQPDSDRQSPRGRQSPADPIKENTHKETHNTEGTPPAGVRVGSKFTLEECRRYARHLQSSGQGIQNPGGYGTTIHRTGEADALIEAFLSPATSASAPDFSQCPDCGGSGFKPATSGAGVARCKHERLKEENSPTA